LKWPFASNWWSLVQPVAFERVLAMDDQEFKGVTKEDISQLMIIFDQLSKLLINPLNKDIEK